MVGVEVRHLNGMAAPELVDDILEALKECGIILGKNGLERNVLAFQPPLVITPENVKDLLDALDSILAGIAINKAALYND